MLTRFIKFAVVAEVALVDLPGVVRPLLGQQVGRALDVARREPEDRALATAESSRVAGHALRSGRARACG